MARSRQFRERILVWVLGPDRAVPENYLSLELNESRIDWFALGSQEFDCDDCASSGSASYDQLVVEAADEAGGQGFVTEYAGTSRVLEGIAYGAIERDQWALVQELQVGGYELIETASAYYRQVDGFRDAIGAVVTLPEGVTLEEFGRNPEMYRDDPALEIDAEAFREALYEFVVEPMQRSQEIFDSRPYLTRMYTKLSADEMTVDPLFTFNADLDDVSNVHTAELVVHCSEAYYPHDVPWTLVLPSGARIEGGSKRELPQELGEGPAASSIGQASASGETMVAIDNGDRISDHLTALPEPLLTPHDPNEDDPLADDDVGPGAGDDDAEGDDAANDGDADDDVDSDAAKKDDDGLCATRAPGAGAPVWRWAWVLALSLVWRRRSR